MIYRSQDIEHNILKLVILGHFLPFYPPPPPPLPRKNPKNQNFEKWKKLTVPEIQSEKDRSFCHFGPFFATFPLSKFWKIIKKMPGDIILLHIHVYHKWKSVGRTPPPPLFLKWINFKYLPGEGGIWKIKKRGWKYGAGVGLLRRKGLPLFLFNFFKVYQFYI